MNNNHPPLPTKTSDKTNPWISLLFRPRLTIRQLLENETDESIWKLWVNFTILITVIAFIFAMLPYSMWEKPYHSIKEWFLGILVFATLNIAMFYLGSYIFWKTSLWLGGQCEKSQMRIVYAWTTIISVVVFGAIGILFTFLFGKESMLVMLTDIIWTLWELVISIAGIREAANLSIWRAGVVVLIFYCLVLTGGILGSIVVFGLVGALYIQFLSIK
jgi:hypothetical protein